MIMVRDVAVVKYYFYKATEAVEFYRPIMYLYFLSLGLSFTHIVIFEALYNVATVVGEIPTGYVGDRIGRRNSLLVGSATITATLVAIALASSAIAFAVLFIVWSTGYNFRSGTEDAWVYETLADSDDTDAFTRVRGRGQSIALAAGVGASLVGGYLGGIDLAYPFLAAALFTGIGTLVILTLDEPETYEESGSSELGFREAWDVVREALGQRRLRSFIVYYYVLFSAVTYLVFIFLQPAFESTMADLGIDVVLSVPIPGSGAYELAVAPDNVETLLGGFYAAMNLASAAVSYRIGFLRERIGLHRWFVGAPLVVGTLLVAMAFVPALAFVALFVGWGIVEPTRVLAGQYVNDRVETLGRATVLSAMAMVSALTVIPFQLGSGVLSDSVSPVYALSLAGGVLVVGSLAILLWESPVENAMVGAGAE
ncbi:major facilitator superfamily MFS_1 [Halovivax asiaticus JCM 14624]|uniref:Major facilitator superfamily MFS_1 n=1 Tax=Halovivax asiaticus JCM 14624 TaxID=1227490 RepID=M0BBB2_9EURY|nr:major facilitator superfamily MFS_1 [Halovivax asiaticus JCM 14624]